MLEEDLEGELGLGEKGRFVLDVLFGETYGAQERTRARRFQSFFRPELDFKEQGDFFGTELWAS